MMTLQQDILQNSNAMYQLIAENMTDMVRIVDLNSGHIIYASPSHEKVLGYVPQQYIEQQLLLQIVHPDDLEAVLREFSDMVEEKQPRRIHYRISHARGGLIYLEDQSTPIVNEHGKVQFILIVSRDVTEKKRVEQALVEREAKYRSITENMTDLVGVVDINCTIRYASPSYAKVLGLDATRMTGTSAYDHVYPEDLDYLRTEFIELIRTKTKRQARLRYMHTDGHLICVESLGTPIIDEHGEIERIVFVARDITDTLHIERKLKESEQRYRRLMELSPQPMASHRDGDILYVNPAAARFLGATDSSEIVGKHIIDFLHPDQAAIANKRHGLVIQKKHIGTIEYKIIRFDGEVLEAETTGIYDDKTDSTLSVWTDITERKQMERALQESEERYRRLVELSPVAIALYKNNKIIYINPAGLKILGVEDPVTIIGTSAIDWIHPDSRQHTRKQMARALHREYCFPGEYKIVRSDGKEMDISASAIYDPRLSAVQVMFEDISARKEAERALLESEELNRRLIELSPEAIILHSDYKYEYVNLAGAAMLGASGQEDLIGTPIFDAIHPDFKAKTEDRLAALYKKEFSPAPLAAQKLVRPDGTIVDAEVIGASIPYKGKTAGLTLIRDVTDRIRAEEVQKRSEQIVRESEERYFRLQTSLDRFSHDLIGIMQVSEMERRLIKEVQYIIQTKNVSLIEVDRSKKVVIRSGDYDIPITLLDQITIHNNENLPLCETIETAEGYFLKVGTVRGSNYFLCIGEKSMNLTITSKRVWLKTISRYVCVLYDSFRLIEDLTKELEQFSTYHAAPSWLLRLLFNLAENERKRLSQDLHDGALQEQIIWYRKLDQLSTDPDVPAELRNELEQITQGLLDVIYQIRTTCNELRPPLLTEEGLVSSLEVLFEFTQIRTDYSIQFDAAEFHHSLNDDQLISLYRIVQELLANAAKHSRATKVDITLSSRPEQIELNYEDNGIGMDVSGLADSFASMGVCGMKERVRSLEGTIEFHSSPNKGLAVYISIPAR